MTQQSRTRLEALYCQRCGGSRFLLEDMENGNVKCTCQVCDLEVTIPVGELSRVQLGKWVDDAPPV